MYGLIRNSNFRRKRMTSDVAHTHVISSRVVTCVMSVGRGISIEMDGHDGTKRKGDRQICMCVCDG